MNLISPFLGQRHFRYKISLGHYPTRPRRGKSQLQDVDHVKVDDVEYFDGLVAGYCAQKGARTVDR